MSYNKQKTDFQVAVAKWLAKRSLPVLMRLGRILGRVIYYLPNTRKRVAQINLEICFPELDRKERKRLLKKNMVSTGQGLMELLAAFWAPSSRLTDRFEISGMQHLKDALSDGKGCLMLSCHTTSLEWGVRGLNQMIQQCDLPVGHVLARQHNNKFLEAYLEEARLGYADKSIDKKNLHGLLKSIKSGHSVYYAPDQNFTYQIEFANFFGRPAATTIGTQKLSQKGVKILPWFCFRTADCQWSIKILPLMDGLAEQSEKQAVQTFNDLFEQQVRQYPEQYLWVHRRFKNQPKGMDNPYK